MGNSNTGEGDKIETGITGAAEDVNTTTPLGFLDARGAYVLQDYEKFHTEHSSFQPLAPFHRPYYVFPRPGDMVCFPSYLIHFAPSHTSLLGGRKTRVAFPMNLQMRPTKMDSWFV